MVRLPTQIELLGGLAVVREGTRTERFSTRKTSLLLAYLALHLGQPVSRDVLIALLWPEDPPEAGRNSLRVALNSLRRQLEPPPLQFGEAIEANRAGVWLKEDQFDTDVRDFRRRLAKASKIDAPEARVVALRGALDLYKGELLPGFSADWLDTSRREVEHLFIRHAEQAIDLLLELGRPDDALVLALRLAAQEPFEDSAHQRLIRTYLVLGRPSEAQAAFDAFETRLLEELGLEPSEELRRLVTDPPEVAVKRSETHTTPSVDEPEEEQNTLPRASSSFHGRIQELDRIRDLITSNGESPRLITLTGLGGIGKTRLALQAATLNSNAFQGGVWFVPLAELGDSAGIGQAVAQAMRLKPIPQANPLDLVLDELRARVAKGPALLVLDNFEQLVGAGETVVDSLLESSPHVHILVTSRIRLRLPGEIELQIGPLDVPDPTEDWRSLTGSGGVSLFLARARGVVPDFQLTERNAHPLAELCRRLEGIPLAIELAAARVRLLTPSQLVSELDQRFSLLVNRRATEDFRHRSLLAVVGQTVNALSAEARDFLIAMSVCKGQWGLGAARAVSGREDAIDLLEELVDLSLLQVTRGALEVQYSMLETIREYVAPLLSAEAKALAEARHAAYFANRAEEMERLYSVNTPRWPSLAHLDRPPRRHLLAQQSEIDRDNMLAAWNWAMVHDPTAALSLAASRRWFCLLSGRLGESESMLVRSLEAATSAPASLRARAYVSLGATRCWSDDFAGAREALDRAMALMEPNQEYERRIARPFIGWVCMHEGKLEEALAHLEEGARLHSEAGELWSGGATLNLMGFAALFLGRFQQAREYFRQSDEVLAEVGDPVIALHSFLGLARIAWLQGDMDEAEDHYRKAYLGFRTHGDRRGAAYAVEGLARVFSTRGTYLESVRMAAAAQTLRDRISLKRDPFDLEAYETVLRTAREHLSPNEYDRAWKEGIRAAGSGLDVLEECRRISGAGKSE